MRPDGKGGGGFWVASGRKRRRKDGRGLFAPSKNSGNEVSKEKRRAE